jgi:hypothetical protein
MRTPIKLRGNTYAEAAHNTVVDALKSLRPARGSGTRTRHTPFGVSRQTNIRPASSGGAAKNPTGYMRWRGLWVLPVNIIPGGATYDSSGHYTLTTVVAGASYIFTKGANDVSLSNVTTGDVTSTAVWVAAGTTVTMNGTPGASVTATVCSGPYMTGDVVILQAGTATGTYICTSDNNTNSPDTGTGWVQIGTTLGQWQ